LREKLRRLGTTGRLLRLGPDLKARGGPLVTDLSHLTPVARARICLDLAADARREATVATGALRESYLLIAESWERLAAQAVSEAGSNL
jgi:hypothetical protein